MICRLSGFFHRIQESEVDKMIKDLHVSLAANDSVFSYRINDDLTYEGEIDEPAGIVGGEMEIIADVDDVRNVANEIFNIFWAYQSEANVQCDI